METVLGGFSATEVTKEGVRKPEPKSDEDLQRIVSEKIRKRKRKKPGNLAKTLDSTLEPRLPPGRPGRPKGSHNYEWTPEKDRRLKELCERYGPAKAKGIMQKELLGSGEFKSRPDSVRNAVERRMLYLGLATGQERKSPKSKSAKTWTLSEVKALLGTVGGNLLDESIEDRTDHTIKAAQAKLVRLGYVASEFRDVAFNVDEMAAMLHVTVRQVRRWKENGWLTTTRRRITEKDLALFLKDHHQRIPFHLLSRDVQIFLMDLGYPAAETAQFRANVKSILDDVAGRKKRCDAREDDSAMSWAKAAA